MIYFKKLSKAKNRIVKMVSFKKFFKIIPRALKLIFLGEKSLPCIHLAERHSTNCELLLNRQAMLSRLKKRGKAAEIGVNQGEFSELILKINKPGLLHLVDNWDSKRYRTGLHGVVDKFRNLIEDGRVQIHRKPSTEAAADFEDDYFDWIYIDTDHSYYTTREELVRYAPKIKLDGIIAGHDYIVGNWSTLCRYGVIEAVQEFCVKHEWELVYLTVESLAENRSFAIRRIGETTD